MSTHLERTTPAASSPTGQPRLVRTDAGWQSTTTSGLTMPAAVAPYQGSRAGLVSRVIANAIDLGVLVVGLTIGYFAVSGVLFLWNSTAFRFPSPGRELALLVGSLLLVLYLAACWATTGRTYGDHVMGLRVVGRGGSRMAWYIAVVRAGFCVLFPIGLFWCGISARRASIQDLVLRTTVLYAWEPVRGPGPDTRPDQASA